MPEILVRILKSGALVNFVLVIIGAAVGMLLKRGIPEKIRKTLNGAVALCVLYIGITGFFEKGINIFVLVLSLPIGALLGELLDLDRAVNRLGEKIQEKSSKNEDSHIAEGFVTATLLFCVGAMTVVGSINSGILGDNSTLYSKSLIDMVSAAVLASSLGFGVMLSSVAVLIIEGGLTLLASVVQPVLSTQIVAHMSVIGSLLIVAIALNMFGITKIKVMNLLPAIFISIPMCFIM